MPAEPTTDIAWAPLPGDGYPPDGDDWDEWYAEYQENIERYEMQLFDLTQMTERAKKVAKLREAEVKRQRQQLLELQREVKQLKVQSAKLEECGIDKLSDEMSTLKFYWSDGVLGCDHNIIPDEWQDELNEANKDE